MAKLSPKTDLRKYFLISTSALGLPVGVLTVQENTTILGTYFALQDAIACYALLALYFISDNFPTYSRLKFIAPSRIQVWLYAVALMLLLWIGTYYVMYNYPLTRDEHMVAFDAYIFQDMRLSWPLALEWKPFVKGLVPAFLLDVPGYIVLASTYGPGNAMLRAGIGSVFDQALVNPLLTGLGLVALYRVSRLLFPTSQGAVVVCLLSYVLSAQVLVNAMTAYAMTPHLVFNLVWLALFLEDKRWTHVLAMIIGVWGIGLHQIVFHPLFAGPLILTLLPQKRWGLFFAYVFVYCGALLFWIGYPTLLMTLADITPSSGSGSGLSGFILARIIPLFSNDHPLALVFLLKILIMAYNLVRFIAWAPAFLLPLVAASLPDIRKNVGLSRPLFAGVSLTLLAVTVILPYQGHGWGYRYLHPVIGNIALLAGYGYLRFTAMNYERANGFVLLGSAVSIVFLLPYLLLTSHNFVAPYAALTKLVNRQTVDFVIIDTEFPRSHIDIVRNLPDLSNRPLVFSSSNLTQADLLELCQRGSVTFFSRREFHRAGFESEHTESSPLFAWRSRILSGRGCVKPPTW